MGTFTMDELNTVQRFLLALEFLTQDDLLDLDIDNTPIAEWEIRTGSCSYNEGLDWETTTPAASFLDPEENPEIAAAQRRADLERRLGQARLGLHDAGRCLREARARVRTAKTDAEKRVANFIELHRGAKARVERLKAELEQA